MPERFARVLKPVLRGLFHPASRFPADPRAVFLLALSVFLGLTTFVLNAAPGTLSSVLPHWAAMVWGGLLAAGSGLTLVGMAKQTAGGIILEQVGSVMVGVTTTFYAGIAIWIAGVDALQPIGIVLAWGLSCFVRWIQLQLLLHDAHQILLRDAARTEARRIE